MVVSSDKISHGGDPHRRIAREQVAVSNCNQYQIDYLLAQEIGIQVCSRYSGKGDSAFTAPDSMSA